ncbi:ketoacyl-ACP synthase III [Salinisphaera sp. USBA-960]|uniref:3-oxoacyl-ACP synthase III family protein n=1 Tax=Salinisphaera orenii TaxID=856731 RepID=UPI000DBE2778|nr:ketoacyl-ACP synthase III [Salifodinibacter halophilus]NNC26649.1 ketoacyl-ACP synthase III [Salifodinibacter halophilus]
MSAVINAIEYVLPARTESIEEIATRFPSWPLEKIAEKTGIRARHIADEDEHSSDFGVAAAERLFEATGAARGDIDFLLVCTQTPDYLTPSTACLIQDRLGLSKAIGALDINLGCSGYIYALGVAKALIESGQAQRLLLITADTYSKFVHPADKSVRALFGDAAAATLMSDSSEPGEQLGPFIYGTDGSGAQDLIVPTSGMRGRSAPASPQEYTDRHGNTRTNKNIFMNGRAIMEFTLREVPAAIHQACDKAGVTLADIDAVVPHQASAMVLDGIRRELDLPSERFVVCLNDIGNTVSCSIPIAVKRAFSNGQITAGSRVLLVGFGVGLSWGATTTILPNDFGSA